MIVDVDRGFLFYVVVGEERCVLGFRGQTLKNNTRYIFFLASAHGCGGCLPRVWEVAPFYTLIWLCLLRRVVLCASSLENVAFDGAHIN